MSGLPTRASHAAKSRVQEKEVFALVLFYLPNAKRSWAWISALAACMVIFTPGIAAQQLAKRLILKDGSYQLATKWEVKGDRVRYLSAERGEWEEVPNSLVDWPATDKFEKERAAGAPVPEAVELDKELEAERQADEAKSPHVAAGLRLPDEGGVILLDTFQNQPQLVEATGRGAAERRPGQEGHEGKHSARGNQPHSQRQADHRSAGPARENPVACHAASDLRQCRAAGSGSRSQHPRAAATGTAMGPLSYRPHAG
ncbi:MAG: hypothetical protein AUH86_16745 [Acidobacteria bacterium 13_1_40CM_4_58_4]|nr:MAG: hypothetical protein AUH86_16745 [Acidobacteria bacterium 13_1_40CM_4_58_4]